jgi:16S rRNA (cytosine967-C5)-methyltransferase
LGLSPKAGQRKNQRPPRSDKQAPAGLAARLTATAMLRQVIERGTALDALLDEKHGNPHFQALDRRDRAFVRAILGAALRRRREIEAALKGTLDRPLPENSGALSAVLHIAATQILFLDVPAHAAVDLAVEQAGADRRTGRARGLVNGVLRNLVRNREEILARAAGNAGRVNMPDWLFARLLNAYGEATALKIADAHLEPPSLDLAVKSEPAPWAEKLGGVVLPTGTVRLAGTHRVSELPGYEEGAWWVQDAAAALPAHLLGDVAGKRVADLCAAPGGKTAQLAAAGADVTAVDLSASRLRRLAENLRRLRLEAHLVAADVASWEPAEPFDAVLLDAPCTATGTIRRHPDIQWLKRPQDIAALAAVQMRLLDHAATLVKPGGRLVFATCSLLPEEGEAQVTPFLTRHPGFALLPIERAEIAGLSELLTAAGTLRTLPCHRFGDAPILAGMDGFFTARFERRVG